MKPSRTQVMRQVRRELTENPRYNRSSTRGLTVYDVGIREGMGGSMGSSTDDMVVVAEILPVIVPIHGNVMELIGYEVPITNITPAYQIWEIRRNMRAFMGESARVGLSIADDREAAEQDYRRRDLEDEMAEYVSDLNTLTIPMSG